jgi:hypothetical protein
VVGAPVLDPVAGAGELDPRVLLVAQEGEQRPRPKLGQTLGLVGRAMSDQQRSMIQVSLQSHDRRPRVRLIGVRQEEHGK